VIENLPEIGPSRPEQAPSIGPSRPSASDAALTMGDDPLATDADEDQPPQSPYSTNRALVHNLTLPSVPDLDIPPSPPGSPPPAIDKKLQQFLELKKKGIHFNSKLEQSSALRNPSLMDKLMQFAEIEGRDQYGTTLSEDLWNPKALPKWASRENLRKSRQKLVSEREAQKANGSRTAVDFVPSIMPSPAGTVSSSGGLSRGEKRQT
jgi:hypothetical protein